MAISFGRGGQGGGASGSNRVGFVNSEQGNTAVSITNHATNFTAANFATPSWQLTLRDTGRASITYGMQVGITFSNNTDKDVDYAVKLQVHVADSRNTGGIPNSGWVDVTGIGDSAGIILNDKRAVIGETSSIQTINGEIPFDLSSLPASALDNKWLQFRFAIRVSAEDVSTISGTFGYIAFKSFGVGAGSTNVGPYELGLGEGAGQANKFVKYNAAGTGFAGESTIATGEIADGAVTSAKIASDAVTQSKIASNSVGASEIRTGAVGTSELADGAVSSAKVADGAITHAKLASDAVEPDNIKGIANSVSNANELIAYDTSGTALTSVSVDSLNVTIQDGSITTAKLADDAVTPAKIDGVATGSTEAGKSLVLDSSGTGWTTSTITGGGGAPADGSITTAKLASDAVTNAKIADNAVQTENINADAITNAKIADDAVDTENIADDAITPALVDGVATGSSEAGKSLVLNSAGTGFTTSLISGGGGGISSVAPGDLDGLAGSATDANKFVRIDSTGDEFALLSELTPSELGLSEGSDEAGKLVSLDSSGTGFSLVTAQSGGAETTLANITGVLSTTKGGTGFNASDMNDLRSKLGIQPQATDLPMVYCNNADTQKNNTIHRVDASTTSLPTELDDSNNVVNAIQDGILIRSGNDQLGVNLADGRQWIRTLTDNNAGVWSNVQNASLSTLSSESELRGLADGSVAVLSSAAANAFRPSFTDGTRPGKVIIGRSDIGGDQYLIATDRYNMWWADRPQDSTWTQIAWHWSGTSTVPQGLYYFGGESDEEHIPVGDVAILGGKSGIDGEGGINVLVFHNITSGTSRYLGYFVDDDASNTIKFASNTRGYTTGSWSRTKLDEAGIDDDIIVKDGQSNEPVFLGIVPAINDITFTSYTFKTSGNITAGDVFWSASQRLLRVVHASGDTHLNDIFKVDFEVEIRKDASNYIRGVFSSVATPPGAVQAVYRSDDLQVVGTIAHDDSVSILGHKAVVTKTDEILPVNLGISHGSGEAGKFVRMNSSGNGFVATSNIATSDIADDAVTPSKVGGVTTGSTEAGKALVLDSAGTAFTTATLSSGAISDGSITTAKLAADAVTNAKLADDAVQTENIADDAITAALIADGAIGSSAIAADAVTSSEIADNAVSNAHIADGAVNTAQLAGMAVTPAKVDGITPNSSLSGHALVFDSQGTGFTTAVLPSGEGGNAVTTTGQLFLGNGNRNAGSDQSWTRSAAGDESDSVVTSVWRLSAKAYNKAVFYYNGWVEHNSTADQTIQIKLQARWHSAPENIGSATWTDVDVFNGDNILLTKDIGGNLANDKRSISAAVPFFLVHLPSGVSDNDYIQFRVQYNLTASGDNDVTWQFSRSRFYGFEIISGASGIGDGTITTAKLADDAVTNAKIGDDAVASENIADNAVVTAALADDAVTSAKIADDAITPPLVSGITTGAAEANKAVVLNAAGTGFTTTVFPSTTIEDGSITNAKLASDAVTNSVIADDAVQTENIADDAITQALIADDAVGASQLASASVVPASISGITTGSGIGGRVLGFDGNGTGFVALEQSSGGSSGSISANIITDKINVSRFVTITRSAEERSGVTDIVFSEQPRFEITDRDNQTLQITLLAPFRMSSSDLSAGNTVSGTGTFVVEYRYTTDAANSTWSAWAAPTFTDSTSAIFSQYNSFTTNNAQINHSINVHKTLRISSLPSAAVNGRRIAIRYRLKMESDQAQDTTPGAGSIAAVVSGFVYSTAGMFSGGGSGSGGAPADGSITAAKLSSSAVTTAKIAAGAVTTAKIADDAITNAKLADDAVTADNISDNAVTNDKVLNYSLDLAKIASLYQVLDDSYTFQADTSSGVDDGKFGYVDNGANGQIAFNVKAADASALTSFVVGSIAILYKDGSNYVVGRQTGASGTVPGDNTEGAFNVEEIKRVGSFADGDAVKLYYGSGSQPESVLKLNNEGRISVGHLEPESMGISPGSSIADHILKIDSAGTGFGTTASNSVGMVKQRLIMRSNINQGDSGETISNISPADNFRRTWTNAQDMQTGTWVIQSKAHDWMSINAAGLYYFGHQLAQPVCADLELWVRWRSPGGTYQNWGTTDGRVTSQTRVQPVAMGSDRLQVTKLFAGGASIVNNALVARTSPDDRAHIDMAVPSGTKSLKLSQLPSAIANGDELQFTVAFASQTPSPSYTVRNFFLQIDILDGGRVIANY